MWWQSWIFSSPGFNVTWSLNQKSIRYADLAINITENSHIFVEAMINIFLKEQYLLEMEIFFFKCSI